MYSNLNFAGDVLQAIVLRQAYSNQRYKVPKAMIGLTDRPSNELQQQVYDHRNVNLRLARVFTGAQKRLYLQVLFDQLKENLDLPPSLVEVGDGGS